MVGIVGTGTVPASAASSPSAGEVGDGKSVGTGISSSAGDETTSADPPEGLALSPGAVGGGSAVFCCSPEVLLGEVGGGTSVGTGISVGEGSPGEILGLPGAEAAVGAGSVSLDSEGVFSWGEVGTGTSVGTGEDDFRLAS